MNPNKIHIVITGMLELTAEKRNEIERAATTLGATLIDARFRSHATDLTPLREDQSSAASVVRCAVDMFDRTMAAAQILSSEDRDTLIYGIAQERHCWEQDWLGDVVGNGYTGWNSHPDNLIIEDALVTNFCLQSIGDTGDRIKLLQIMARPEVFAIVTEFLIELGADDDTLDKMISSLESAARQTRELKAGSPELAEVKTLVETIVEQLETLEDSLRQPETAPEMRA